MPSVMLDPVLYEADGIDSQAAMFYLWSGLRRWARDTHAMTRTQTIQLHPCVTDYYVQASPCYQPLALKTFTVCGKPLRVQRVEAGCVAPVPRGVVTVDASQWRLGLADPGQTVQGYATFAVQPPPTVACDFPEDMLDHAEAIRAFAIAEALSLAKTPWYDPRRSDTMRNVYRNEVARYRVRGMTNGVNGPIKTRSRVVF